VTKPLHSGYRLTDWLLLNPHATAVEKLYVGRALTFRERNPGLSLLQATTPATRTALSRAQRSCEEKGFLVLDRPRFGSDRNANNPRFARSNKIVSFHPQIETRRREGQAPPLTITITGELVERLPRGSGVDHGPYAPLVALLYAREQIRRGGIQLPHAVTAARLNITERIVKRVEKDMLALGALKVIKDGNEPIYRLLHVHVPDATPRDNKTPRMRQLGPEAIIATNAQWTAIDAMTVDLDDAQVADLLSEARARGPYEHDPRPVEASFVLLALEARKHHEAAVENTMTPSQKARGSLPVTSDQSLVRQESIDRSTGKDPSLRLSEKTKALRDEVQGGAGGSQGQRRGNAERWVFSTKPEMWVWADPKIKARLTVYLNALDKYDKPDRDSILRRHLLRSNGSGRKLLKLLDTYHGDLPPPDVLAAWQREDNDGAPLVDVSDLLATLAG
jgi:hypothetical protein